MSSENLQSADALLQALAGMLNDYFCEKQPSENLGTVLDVSSGAQAVPIDEVYPLTSTASGDAPWDDLTGLAAETNLLYKMPPEVTAKMNWVIDNIPRMSKQRIVRTAVNTELERLIGLYHRP